MDHLEYVVTFCIPTYNRVDVIWRVITQILSSPEPRFQIVVSDNGSTDNTWDKLATISDSRLKLCKNPFPSTPGTLNWLNALNQGDGRWLYLVMGRDLILADNIPKLINCLETIERKSNVAFIYDNIESISEGNEYKYYSKKADALKRFMIPMHPTGSIFRKDVFRSIPDKERACNVIDTFPENYFKSTIIEKYKSMEIPSIVNKKPGWAWGERIPRSTFDLNPNSLYWNPKRKIKQCIQTMELVSRNTLSIAEHDMLFQWEWEILMSEVSTNFKERMMDKKKYTYHYGVQPRNVTKKEMITNILQAYCEVSRHYRHMSFKRKRMLLSTMMDKFCKILIDPYYSRLKIRIKDFIKRLY